MKRVGWDGRSLWWYFLFVYSLYEVKGVDVPRPSLLVSLVCIKTNKQDIKWHRIMG